MMNRGNRGKAELMTAGRAKKLLFILAFAAILTACEEKLENNPIEQMIIGNWSEMQSFDTIQTLQKFNSLPDDNYSIAFLENGQLMENKNIGWCGTPPISYGEHEGTWELQDDSTLLVESTYWGGDMTMTWRILEIDNTKLSYYALNYYYEDFN